MKKKASFLVLAVFVLVSVVSAFIRPAAASDSSTCPDWLFNIEGECLSDNPGQVQVESVYFTPGHSLLIDTQWQPDRWLLKIAITPPINPVLPFGMNLNKYRLEYVAVYADQRQLTANPPAHEGEYFDSLSVFVRLVCDANGSAQPTLALSVPRQNIVLADGTTRHRIPRATLLEVVNWEEMVNSACNY